MDKHQKLTMLQADLANTLRARGIDGQKIVVAELARRGINPVLNSSNSTTDERIKMIETVLVIAREIDAAGCFWGLLSAEDKAAITA